MNMQDLLPQGEPDSKDEQGNPVLYHYTNYYGLEGIVRSKTMWCTQIQYLNDFSELRHGLDLLAKIGRKEFNGTHFGGDETNTYINSLANARMFVCSFTEAGDLLSQWRGYTGSSGASVSFSVEALRKQANQNGYTLHPCIYDEQVKIAKTRQYIEGILTEENRRMNIIELTSRFLPLAALFKDGSFSEEKEWRLISPLIESDLTRIKVRAMPAGLVPYMVLNLNTRHQPFTNMWRDNEDICIRGITMGPNKEQELQRSAVMSLFESSNAAWWTINLSTIPFRSL